MDDFIVGDRSIAVLILIVWFSACGGAANVRLMMHGECTESESRVTVLAGDRE